MSPTLYEVGVEFARLETLLYEQGGEWTPEVEAAFTALGEMERDRVDAYQHVIANLTAHATGCQEEAKRLAEKADVALNAAKRLKERLKEYMEVRGVTALQGDRWLAVIQRNGGKPPLVLDLPVEQLPSRFVRYTPAPDSDALRAAAMTDGSVIGPEGVQIAHVDPPGTHLRFR